MMTLSLPSVVLTGPKIVLSSCLGSCSSLLWSSTISRLVILFRIKNIAPYPRKRIVRFVNVMFAFIHMLLIIVNRHAPHRKVAEQ